MAHTWHRPTRATSRQWAEWLSGRLDHCRHHNHKITARSNLLLNQKPRTTTFFIRVYPQMTATGWRLAIMVTVSDRGSQRIGDLTERVIGFGLTAGGTGIRASVLPGQRIITADGPILTERDGAGFPEINGLQPGSRGGKVPSTSAGPHFHPKRTSRRINQSRHGLTRIMTSGRLPTPLLALLIGGKQTMRATSSDPSEIFRSSERRKT